MSSASPWTALVLLLATGTGLAQDLGEPEGDEPPSHRRIEIEGPEGAPDWALPSPADRESLERMQRMLQGIQELHRHQQRDRTLVDDPERLRAELDRLRIDPELRRIALEYAMRHQEEIEGADPPPTGLGDPDLEARLRDRFLEWIGRERPDGPGFDPPAGGTSPDLPGHGDPAAQDLDPGALDPGDPASPSAPGETGGSDDWEEWLGRKLEKRFQGLVSDARQRMEEEEGDGFLDHGRSILDLVRDWRREGGLDLPGASGPAPSTGGGSSPLAYALIGLGAAGLVLVALAARRVRPAAGRARRPLVVRMPERVETRADLVLAHDSAVVLVLGESALPLSHREAAVLLEARRPDLAGEIARASSLYALCRYAPPGWAPAAGELAAAADLLAALVRSGAGPAPA